MRRELVRGGLRWKKAGGENALLGGSFFGGDAPPPSGSRLAEGVRLNRMFFLMPPRSGDLLY
jgi:hypothetical protein